MSEKEIEFSTVSRQQFCKVGVLFCSCIAPLLINNNQLKIEVYGKADVGKSLLAEILLAYLSGEEGYSIPPLDKFSLEAHKGEAAFKVLTSTIPFNDNSLIFQFTTQLKNNVKVTKNVSEHGENVLFLTPVISENAEIELANQLRSNWIRAGVRYSLSFLSRKSNEASDNKNSIKIKIQNGSRDNRWGLNWLISIDEEKFDAITVQDFFSNISNFKKNREQRLSSLQATM